jgi:aldose 1-epimerase
MSLFTHRVTSVDGGTSADFVPDAGMLCCSLERDGEQLLDLGKGLAAYAAHGHTMGIPLLYPWANRLERFEYRAAGKFVTFPDDRALTHADPNGLPIHGAIPGLMRWEPHDRVDHSTLSARLEWNPPSPSDLQQLYPFAHEVDVEAAIAPGALAIATHVRAVGSDEVPISFGYHPYLRPPGGPRDGWRLKLPRLERLAHDAQQIPTGAREPVADTEVELADSSWDDGFAVLEQPARFEVIDDESGHGIAVELLEGYPFAQIFAPPGHDFICFEPMTAPTNALSSGDGLTVLSPGEEYRAVFRVSAW